MSSLFSPILSLLLVYRYAALFIITFLGSLGIPVLAGPSTIAASAFARQGYFSIFWVMVSGSAGNIGGDLTMYWLVRRYGQKVLIWLHLRKLANSPALNNIETTANTYSVPVIIFSRFQAQACVIVNIITGLGKMPFKRFAILIGIGEILQMAFYVTIGFMFEGTWQSIYTVLGKFSWIIAFIAVIIFIFLSNRIVQKNQNHL
jgi:membrane-associated protein